MPNAKEIADEVYEKKTQQLTRKSSHGGYEFILRLELKKIERVQKDGLLNKKLKEAKFVYFHGIRRQMISTHVFVFYETRNDGSK